MTEFTEVEREVVERARGDELYREIGEDYGLTVPEVSRIASRAVVEAA